MQYYIWTIIGRCSKDTVSSISKTLEKNNTKISGAVDNVKENTKIDYNNKDTINFILLKNFLLKYILLIFNSYLLNNNYIEKKCEKYLLFILFLNTLIIYYFI